MASAHTKIIVKICPKKGNKENEQKSKAEPENAL